MVALRRRPRREHLDRHPVQPRDHVLRPAGHPGGALRGGVPGRGERLAAFLADHLPAAPSVTAITLLLGFVYTLKVFDIIWIMTKGGPSGSSTTLAIWSYQLGFGSLLPDFSSAATVGNVLIVIALVVGQSTRACSADWRCEVATTTVTRAVTTRSTRGRQRATGTPPAAKRWWRTALGVVLTAVMLFPVYWMVNVSLTRDQDMRKSPPNLIPIDGTLHGYSTVLGQAVAVPRHEPARRPRHGRADARAVGSGRLLARQAGPPGRRRHELRAPHRADDPAIIMAMGFYTIYVQLGILDTCGAHPRRLDDRGALRRAHLRAFMRGSRTNSHNAARIDGASTWRTFTSVVMPVSRNSIVTVSLFSFLWAWSDFLFANNPRRRRDAKPITSASTPTSATTTRSGTRSWPPPWSRRSPPRCSSSSPSATSPPCHRRRREGLTHPHPTSQEDIVTITHTPPSRPVPSCPRPVRSAPCRSATCA